jgi:2'-5' RNA ligase
MAAEPAGPRIRSFVAVDVDGPARDAVAALLARCRATGADVAWSRPDALHVTLTFLGSVEPERLARLGARLADVAATQAPFALALRGVGAFPSLAHPSVLWIGVDAPALVTLAAAVNGAAAAEGFAAEARAFRPHLTLGRVRRGDRRHRRGSDRERDTVPAALRTLLDGAHATSFGRVDVAEMILFRSDLGAGGARHTALGRYPLSALRGEDD